MSKLVRQRTILGLTQKEAAKLLGVGPATLAPWERGEREPVGELQQRVEGFLRDDAATEELLRVG